MVNVKNELIFLLVNLKAFISFKIKIIINYILNGHFVKKKKIKNYLKSNQFKKIHLGSTFDLEGFLNSQIVGDVPIDICKKLPFKNNIIDLIFTCHVVEHIHFNQMEFFLKESLRVLKNGGINIITTPSISKISKILYGPDPESKKNLLQRQIKIFKQDFSFFSVAMMMNIIMRSYGHRFIYDYELIKKIAEKVGYKKVYLVSNNDLAKYDVKISNYVNSKGNEWSLETESFCLEK